MPFDFQSRSRHGINRTCPPFIGVGDVDPYPRVVDRDENVVSLESGYDAAYDRSSLAKDWNEIIKSPESFTQFWAMPTSGANNQVKINRRSPFSTGSISRPVTINFTYNHKVVPKSVVNPDCLKPLNCKGLFTTTHAKTHRPLRVPLVMASDGHQAVYSNQPFGVEFDRLPDRNSKSGLIGIGLASGLRTLSRFQNKNSFNHKVVPKSVVNPDCLKPLNCKGLFATSHAKTHRLSCWQLKKVTGIHSATCTKTPSVAVFEKLLDRIPKLGLISIGLVSWLRTLFYEN